MAVNRDNLCVRPNGFKPNYVNLKEKKMIYSKLLFELLNINEFTRFQTV